MYADNTAIYAPISKKPTSQELNLYQSDLNALSSWCYDNKLSINTNKTKLMILGTNRHTKLDNLPIPLSLNSQPLDIVPTYKYLGLTLNSQLTFREHTTQIINFASYRINSLIFFKKYVNHNTLLQIYKTTILPIFEYANIIHPLVPKHLNLKKTTATEQSTPNNFLTWTLSYPWRTPPFITFK